MMRTHTQLKKLWHKLLCLLKIRREYLYAYPTKGEFYRRGRLFHPGHPKYPYFSRLHKPYDCIIYFRTEREMLAFDHWDVEPPLNYKDIIEQGRNLAKRVVYKEGV